MKYYYDFLCLLILSSFASYGQNVYQHFSELNGMEDYNGNTNLLYRISSAQQYPYYFSTINNIYLFNVSNKIDSLFQLDYYYYGDIGPASRSISGYDFWEKDPHKFIVCGAEGGIETSPFVERFDKIHITLPQFGDASFIGISRQNDSLVYSTCRYNDFSKSTDGGVSWDTAGHFNALSLSPYNDKILFSSENGILYKTTNGGITKYAVDTIPTTGYHTDFLFYDKDTNYIYRVVCYYLQGNPVYKLFVSNNSGQFNSWQLIALSASQIYVAVDNAAAGSLYFATGKVIWHSTNFGKSFTLVPAFDRDLVGIYKKPGSTKLYAATYNTIFELDGLAKNIIRQIPVDPEIFKFDPIDIGNRWYYKTSQSAKGVLLKEIVKDTVLANQKPFRQIKQQLIDSISGNVSYSYERIDSTTGDVYGWRSDSTEYIIDNLNHNPGDIFHVSRYFGIETVFDSLKSITLFGLPIETRVFSSSGPFISAHYYLSKNIGLSYLQEGIEAVLITNELKGAVIKGIVYDDTSTVVGITDQYPNSPKQFVLSQNFPNPFNPSTTINYSLPKAGNVKLTVYNAIGSQVAIILNEYKPAGNYSVQFNAGKLASGIYLYRLESGNFSTAKKFILIK